MILTSTITTASPPGTAAPSTPAAFGTGQPSTSPSPPRSSGQGGRPRRRVDPADRAQLAEHPVALSRVAALFSPFRAQVALVVVLIMASSLVALASPFLVRFVIDDAIPNQDVPLLVWAVAGMIAVAAVTSLLGVVQTWIATTVGQRVMHGLRTSVFAHLQRQSLGFFTRTRGGEVQSRLTNDIGGMQSVVTNTATGLAANATTVVGTAVAMAVMSWRLSLLSLVVLPPSIWITRQVAQMRRGVTAKLQRRMADMQTQVEEGLSVSGVLLGKTLGTGPSQSQRFAATSGDLAGLEVRSQLAGRWRMATMSIVFAAIPALIYLAAGLPATSGGMTIGTLVAFTGLQAALFRPVLGLLSVGVQLTTSMALFSRIFEYLDLPVEIADPEEPVAVDPERVRGEVRLDGVGFSYPEPEPEPDPKPGAAPERPDGTADGAAAPARRAALTDVTLHVPAGGSLALVGATGSGKSTLASLVSRLQDPTTGTVSIDGVDVRDMTLEALSQIVGVVSQETYLLHTTVRENLATARPGATDDEIELAARRAQVHDVIAGLPDGYDTMVGARGHRFSGGEGQRIAIARTLLRDPRVLVLDEATSALDNATERAVQAALDEASRGRTTITIAHRLSTVRGADTIAVLDRGRVVEQGSHEELMTAGGAYAALVASAERSPAVA